LWDHLRMALPVSSRGPQAADPAAPDPTPPPDPTSPAAPEPAPAPEPAAVVPSAAPDAPRLLRIQEVASETGLTPRSIRYYEEIGLLRPAARSQGSYRLYDASDLERLGFIRGLRDDAGFSLAEIALLLEDEEARIRDRERFRAAGDEAEKRAILRDLLSRMDRQVSTLTEKAERLREMIEAAESRREHLRAHLAELEGGSPAHLPGAPHGDTGP
jgi:MerR family transcriptional regulator, repressor of the yfmOP operon